MSVSEPCFGCVAAGLDALVAHVGLDLDSLRQADEPHALLLAVVDEFAVVIPVNLRHVVRGLLDVPPASAYRSRSLEVGRVLCLDRCHGFVLAGVHGSVVRVAYLDGIRQAGQLYLLFLSVEDERLLVIPANRRHVDRSLKYLPLTWLELALLVVAGLLRDEPGGRVVDARICRCIALVYHVESLRDAGEAYLRGDAAQSVEEALLVNDFRYGYALRGPVIHERLAVCPAYGVLIDLYGCRYDFPAAAAERRLLVIGFVIFKFDRSLVISSVCRGIAAVDRSDALRQSREEYRLLVSVIDESLGTLPFDSAHVVCRLGDAPLAAVHLRRVVIVLIAFELDCRAVLAGR